MILNPVYFFVCPKQDIFLEEKEGLSQLCKAARLGGGLRVVIVVVTWGNKFKSYFVGFENNCLELGLHYASS